MGVLPDIGPMVTVDPKSAFQAFEAEGEQYVRFRLQGRLYEKELSALAAAWLLEKDTLRAKLRRVRRRRARFGWMIVILGAAAVAAYSDQADFPVLHQIVVHERLTTG
jgi:hypothetical protein